MEYETLVFEVKEKIGWITLNRPKAMNAMNTKMVKEFSDLMDKIQENEDVGVVIIKGSGDKAFSAGADLKEIAALGIKGAFDYSRSGQALFRKIEQSGKPVIASINGMSMGGGAEMILSCHLRIAAEGVTIGFPEAGLGGIPAMGGTQRLPRLIGKSVALSFLLSGDMISAEKGVELGLIHKVVPKDELEKKSEGLAKKLLKKSPLSLKFIIQAVNNGMEGHVEEGLLLESTFMAAMTGSEDKKEGIKAIFEKRAPVFKGE